MSMNSSDVSITEWGGDELELLIQDWLSRPESRDNVQKMIIDTFLAARSYKKYGHSPDTREWHDNQLVIFSMLTES